MIKCPSYVRYMHIGQVPWIILSPFSCTLKLQATLIDPCIKGTLNVINSCTKSSSVKRIVLTSSCSSIRYRYDAQQVSPLNESHWSDLDYCQSKNVGLYMRHKQNYQVNFPS